MVTDARIREAIDAQFDLLVRSVGVSIDDVVTNPARSALAVSGVYRCLGLPAPHDILKALLARRKQGRGSKKN